MNSFLRIRAHNSEDRATQRIATNAYILASLVSRWPYRPWIAATDGWRSKRNRDGTHPWGRAAIVAGSSSQAMHVQVTPARGQDTPCFH
jgi:hypothetical protein